MSLPLWVFCILVGTLPFSIYCWVQYFKAWYSKKEPDAILYFDVSGEEPKASFLFLLPISEMERRNHLNVEVRHSLKEDVYGSGRGTHIKEGN